MRDAEYKVLPCEICGKPVKVIDSFIVDDPLSVYFNKRINNPVEFRRPIHGNCI